MSPVSAMGGKHPACQSVSRLVLALMLWLSAGLGAGNAWAAAPDAQGTGTAMRIALILKAPIEQGLLEVEAVDRYIVIRIPETPSFAPGQSVLRPSYLPVIAAVREALKLAPGQFSVAGHIDDVPVSTARYRSGWEFAASRASAVLAELLNTGELAEARFTLVSHGATRPILHNTSDDNRLRNRRVEIVIQY